MFNENVDKEVEWIGVKQNPADGESSYSSEDANESSGFESIGSNEDDVEDCASTNRTSSSHNPSLEIGKNFSTKL